MGFILSKPDDLRLFDYKVNDSWYMTVTPIQVSIARPFDNDRIGIRVVMEFYGVLEVHKIVGDITSYSNQDDIIFSKTPYDTIYQILDDFLGDKPSWI